MGKQRIFWTAWVFVSKIECNENVKQASKIYKLPRNIQKFKSTQSNCKAAYLFMSSNKLKATFQ